MKKIYLLIMLVIGSLIANAQVPYWQWAKSPGGSNYYNGAESLTTDVKGYIYITGDYDSAIIFGGTTLSGGGCFVAKYDTSGNVLWAKSSSGNLYAIGLAITTDAGGNVYITGQYDDTTITFGSYTLSAASPVSAFFIVKYDSSGNVLWAKNSLQPAGTGGAENENAGTGISTDRLGNIYATGYFNSASITFGGITLNNPPAGEDYTLNDNFFIVKYNPSGNVIWAQKANGSGSGSFGPSSSAFAIKTDLNENVYITGWFDEGLIFDTSVLDGYSSFFIAKYDSAGNALWGKGGLSYGGGFAIGYSTTTDMGGNVYVTGIFSGPEMTFGSDSLINAGGNNDSSDIFIAKYNSLGHVLWAKKAGGTGNDEGIRISVDGYDNSYITGCFYSSSIAFGPSVLTNNGMGGKERFFAAKYDSSGNPVWGREALGNGGNIGTGISADGNNNVSIAGSFTAANITFGSTVLTNTGNGAIFVAKIANCILPASPLNTTAPAAQSVCMGYSTALTVTGTGVIQWYSADTGGILLATGTGFTTPVLNSSVTYYVQDSTCGASPRRAIMVVVHPKPSSYVYLIGSDTLATETFVNYQWVENDTAVPGADAQMYLGFSSGNYQVIVGDTNGCVDTSAAYMFCVLPAAPTNTTPTAAQAVCSGNSTILTAIGTGTLSWYSASTGGDYLETGASFITPILTSDSVFYVQDFTCGASPLTAITVTVYPGLTPAINPSGNNSLSTGSFVSYQWLINGNAIGNGTAQTYTPASNGDYQVIVTDNHGCSDTSLIYGFTLGIAGVEGQHSIILYPNPSTGDFHFSGVTPGSTIQVYNVLGEIIYYSIASSDNFRLSLNTQSKGIYFYRVNDNGNTIGQGKLLLE